ncbi:MAG: DUF1559 domain-containing protein [Planctomycetaceae bacterium]|nr:DUF1559 domain-containing protein [Planctomycetales bacterium]MCB9923358.1 DUF1559 domain-containing protein [Planctomycetaceae bacterium]
MAVVALPLVFSVTNRETGLLAAIIFSGINVGLLLLLWRWVASNNTAVGDCIAGSVVTTLLFALLYPSTTAIHCGGSRTECGNNFKQIILALHHYHDSHESLPPAYLTDDNDIPMHSWRVLILPYLEPGGRYSNYQFDSPWNSDQNLPLAATSPEFYRCPLSESPKGETNYLAVVGTETIWPMNNPTKFMDVDDGTANTIAVVESHASGILWTEPSDLSFANMNWQINAENSRATISSKHPGGAIVAAVDGSVRFISEKIDPEVLQMLTTRRGGEQIESEDWW